MILLCPAKNSGLFLFLLTAKLQQCATQNNPSFVFNNQFLIPNYILAGFINLTKLLLILTMVSWKNHNGLFIHSPKPVFLLSTSELPIQTSESNDGSQITWDALEWYERKAVYIESLITKQYIIESFKNQENKPRWTKLPFLEVLPALLTTGCGLTLFHLHEYLFL